MKPGQNEAQKNFLAQQLLWETITSLGNKFSYFVVAIGAIVTLSLLPVEYFRFFTAGTDQLSNLAAKTFLEHLLLFGGLVSLSLLGSSFASILLQEWLRLSLEGSLRQKILKRLHLTSLDVLDDTQRRDWLSRITADMSQTESFLTESLPRQIKSLMLLFVSGILFVVHRGPIALFPLFSVLVLALINRKVHRGLAPILSELSLLHSGVRQLLIESLEGLRTIRSLAIERYTQQRLDHKIQNITRKSQKVIRTFGALRSINELTSQAMITFLWVVAIWAMWKETLLLTEVLVYPFYIGIFYSAAKQLACASNDWNRFYIEGGRLAQILYNEAKPFQKIPCLVATNIKVSSLQIENLDVSYPMSPGSSLTLTLRTGEICAVIGASNSGKSTLLEVIAGIRKVVRGRATLRIEESVLWERDTQNDLLIPLDLSSYVERRPYLFEGSVYDNLTLGNEMSEPQIWGVLERVGIAEFVRRSGGLNFFIPDRGKNLSEGERYRLALARALLVERPYLLLEEPFAALDAHSIEFVVGALDEAKRTRGILLVTHYLPPLLSPETVIRFDSPQCIEVATPVFASPFQTSVSPTALFPTALNNR